MINEQYLQAFRGYFLRIRNAIVLGIVGGIVDGGLVALRRRRVVGSAPNVHLILTVLRYSGLLVETLKRAVVPVAKRSVISEIDNTITDGPYLSFNCHACLTGMYIVSVCSNECHRVLIARFSTEVKARSNL